MSYFFMNCVVVEFFFTKLDFFVSCISLIKCESLNDILIESTPQHHKASNSVLAQGALLAFRFWTVCGLHYFFYTPFMC